jgi:hypothetical protein
VAVDIRADGRIEPKDAEASASSGRTRLQGHCCPFAVNSGEVAHRVTCRAGTGNPMALDCRISQGAGVSTEQSPVEHEDRWILNLRGMSVTRISVDFRLVLALDPDWEVALEAPVSLSHGTAHANPSMLLNPESQDVAAALALFGAKILSAVAFKSGTLRLVFDTGHHLTCTSDPSFEAWQVTGPTGWRFTSPPGGDLAVWSGSGASES